MSIIPESGPDNPANIKARLYTEKRTWEGELAGKTVEVVTRGHRHYLKVDGEVRPELLCNKCGAAETARGCCCGCGSPAGTTNP
jgi:hypothetical protein